MHHARFWKRCVDTYATDSPVPELAQEQDNLLARQQHLNAQQAELQAALDDKANEYLLLAKLRAIDYSLGEQRIGKTREAERLVWLSETI